MTSQVLLSGTLFCLGSGAFAVAIRHERLMQRHRQPGTSWRAATMRMDGGWRRRELFRPEGLVHQRRAAAFGFVGMVSWAAALGAWIVLGWR